MVVMTGRWCGKSSAIFGSIDLIVVHVKVIFVDMRSCRPWMCEALRGRHRFNEQNHRIA